MIKGQNTSFFFSTYPLPLVFSDSSSFQSQYIKAQIQNRMPPPPIFLNFKAGVSSVQLSLTMWIFHARESLSWCMCMN